ncbi:hypothetical protein ZWY2020_053955 [Hordeum vulgare]|nr:hypothetical protein ZWY2020_053955 [Hordeum vulgare]
MRIYYAQMFAYQYNITEDATPEAKYDSFVAVFSESLRIIVGILEVHAVKPPVEEVKGPIPAGELKAIDQIAAAFRTAATAADAVPKKDKSTIFDSAFSKAIKDTMDGAYQGYKFVPALESGVKEAYSLLLPQRPQNKLMVFEAVLRETILAMAAGATAPATPATDAAATATPTPPPLPVATKSTSPLFTSHE